MAQCARSNGKTAFGARKTMKTSGATVDVLNAHIASIPFNAWLGAEVIARTGRSVELRVPWRLEFGGAPGMTHGGILASLVDTAGFLVLLAAHGTGGPTVDIRIDFHRSTTNSELLVRGRLIGTGATISTVEVEICDSQSRLVASGRCVFLTQSRRRPDSSSSRLADADEAGTSIDR